MGAGSRAFMPSGSARWRDQLQLGLGREPIRASVWLLSPPLGGGVHEEAWVFVCLAAVAAMEYGRARLWALRSAAGRAGGGGTGGAGGVPLPPAVVSGGGRAAAAHFWHTLHDFVMADPSVLPRWELPQHHPFVAPGLDGRLRVACLRPSRFSRLCCMLSRRRAEALVLLFVV